MTEEQSIQPQVSEDDGIERDPFIQTLVDATNGTGVGAGITLHSHGMLVSGDMISLGQFFELVREGFAGATAHTDSDELATTIRGFFVGIAGKWVEAAEIMKEKEAEEPGPPPSYIHLKNVVMVVPGQDVFRLPLWRGRISEISGFSIGNIQTG
ncbi:hypothetical protein ABIA22_000343 [Sinorhizobium fredii]|uniref:hypothetical protein n=1 Tax=Rhizobium fredii TaxID=380 RepID=UPI00351184A9